MYSILHSMFMCRDYLRVYHKQYTTQYVYVHGLLEGVTCTVYYTVCLCAGIT